MIAGYAHVRLVHRGLLDSHRLHSEAGRVVLEILGTVAAAFVLAVVEVWVIGSLFGFVALLLNMALLMPVSGRCPVDPDFAATHPWRYHYSHFTFWAVKWCCAFAILASSLFLVKITADHFAAWAYYFVLYIEAVVLSVQFFPNDANSLTPVCALSYRLRGKQANVRSRPQLGTVGPTYLDPITVTRHGW